MGENPVASTERRKVARRIYATLRAEEVPLLLAEVPASGVLSAAPCRAAPALPRCIPLGRADSVVICQRYLLPSAPAQRSPLSTLHQGPIPDQQKA